MASRSAAPPASKVFVGGLTWETQSEALRRHFEHFGDILEAVVISDKTTGRSKGYGFVTFRDPESARRACADPSPVIEGRRANCNLASMGRPRPAPHYAHIGPAGPYFGGLPIPQVAHIGVGSSTYNPAVLYNYQQAIAYPPYGYTAYEPEYVYPQNVFNPYTGQQYVQLYNVPGTLNPAIYPYGQFGQSVPSGHGYTAIPGYTVSGHHILRFTGPTVNGASAAPLHAIQSPFPAGLPAPVPVPAQPQFIIPAHLPQGSGSDQTAS